MKNLSQSHTLDRTMRCLDINLRLVQYFKFCYVCMCAFVNINLYFYIDSKKLRVLILFPVYLLWTKHSMRGRRYFADKQSILFARKAHQHFIQAFSGWRLENFKKLRMIRTSVHIQTHAILSNFFLQRKEVRNFTPQKNANQINRPNKKTHPTSTLIFGLLLYFVPCSSAIFLFKIPQEYILL